MKKKIKIIFITLVLLILFIPVTTILLIRPTEKLDLQYTSIDLEKKISEDLFSFNGNISLKEDALTNILKGILAQNDDEALDYVTGVALDIEDGNVNLYINIEYNIFKVGVRGVASMEIVEDDLVVTPKKFYLGRIPISPKRVFALLNKLNPDTSEMINENGQFVTNLKEMTTEGDSEFVSINNISLKDDSLYVFFDMPSEIISTAVSTGIDIAINDDRIKETTRTEIANSLKKHSNNTISNKTIENLSNGKITAKSKNEILETINDMSTEEQNSLLKEVSNLVDPEILEQYMQN